MKLTTSRLRLEQIEGILPESGLFDRVPMDDPHLSPTFFSDALKNGARLYHLKDDEGNLLALTCFLWDAQRQEVELLATQSLDNRFQFTQAALPLVEQVAKTMGAKSLRICTLRKGLIALCADKCGFRIAEVTLRKNLP